MKQKRRGFTLIELLAVIVILAIIALIAVPVIMNIISSARKSAFEDTAYGLINAGEMYYTSHLLNDGILGDTEFTITDGKFVGENKLDVKGELPKNGKIKVTKDGKVAIAIDNGNYCITKATTESKIQTDDSVGECDYRRVTNAIITSMASCIKNPSEQCSEADIKAGIAVQIKVNETETKNFYVISDDTENNKLTLIMNKNIDEKTIAWISEKDYGCEEANCSLNEKGPITALNYLESKTSSWTNIPSKTYSLIDDQGKYTIDRNNVRVRMLSKTEALSLGCVADEPVCPSWMNNGTGFWLSSTHSSVSISAWDIDPSGVVNSYSRVSDDIFYGVRPVIEIPKTII